MSASSGRAVLVLVVLAAFASGCTGPSTAAGPKLWRESSDTAVPPDLARVATQLADLTER